MDTVHGRSLLGFFTAQLNRPHPDSVSRNQLDVFFAQGILKGERPAAWDKAPRWRPIEDESASLDIRARSYVAITCSGCHGARGMMMGATFGSKAEPGTIRGDLGVSNSFNLIHGSDSPEAAQRELGLFFKPDELIDWTPAIQSWVYDLSKGQPE